MWPFLDDLRCDRLAADSRTWSIHSASPSANLSEPRVSPTRISTWRSASIPVRGGCLGCGPLPASVLVPVFHGWLLRRERRFCCGKQSRSLEVCKYDSRLWEHRPVFNCGSHSSLGYGKHRSRDQRYCLELRVQAGSILTIYVFFPRYACKRPDR